MQIPKFKPAYLNSCDRVRPWYVSIPPYLSPTGRPQRRFFLTLRECKAFGDYMRRQYDDHLHDSTYLSRDQLAEAGRAYKLLEQFRHNCADVHNCGHQNRYYSTYRHTLLSIVEDFIERERLASKSISLEGLIDEYTAARRTASPHYLADIQALKLRLPRLILVIVSNITPHDIDHALRGHTPCMRNAMLATLRAMLNYAMKRGYVDQNPVAKVEFSVVRLGEVQIYTPDEVQRILDDCLEHDLGLLPYRVLTLYCGIRPHGEATRLRWSDVSLADKIVKLHGSITKKGRSRYPALSDNAVAWLEAYRPRCPIWEGPVVPYSRYVLESHCKANLRRAGVKGIKNGSRHSYISYHLAMHQDIDGLTIQSGHRSIQTVWAHYYRAATKAEAEKYWSIVPTTVTDKVMAFNA